MRIRYNDHFVPTDEERAHAAAFDSNETVKTIMSILGKSFLKEEDVVKEYKDSTLSIECSNKRTAIEKQRALTNSLLHDFDLTDPAEIRDAHHVFHARNNKIYTSIALLGRVLGIEAETNQAVSAFHNAQNPPFDYALNTASFTEYHNPENAKNAIEALLRSKCDVMESPQTSDQVSTITGSHRLIQGYQRIIMHSLGVRGYEKRSGINPGYSRLIINVEEINDALQRAHDRKYNTTPTPHSSQDSASTVVLDTPDATELEARRHSTRIKRSRSDAFSTNELHSPAITPHKERKTDTINRGSTR